MGRRKYKYSIHLTDNTTIECNYYELIERGVNYWQSPLAVGGILKDVPIGFIPEQKIEKIVLI